jgi:hypothetical protein
MKMGIADVLPSNNSNKSYRFIGSTPLANLNNPPKPPKEIKKADSFKSK